MARIHGFCSGWTEYRYGSKGRKPVSLPRIFKGEKKAHILDSVLDMMRDWRSSPFENEGACRAGIRSALCMEGHSWIKSDNEAGALVTETLRTMGAQRPDWIEGQHQHTDSLDRCSWCCRPMPEDSKPAQRFCSEVCARSAIQHRGNKAQHNFDVTQRAAYRLIARRKSPKRPCQHCGMLFQSDRKDAKFCSTLCASHHQKGENLWHDMECAECGTVFHPTNKGQRFCSHTCHGKVRHREMRDSLSSVRRICKCCNAEFTPKADHSIYCGPRCASVMAKRAYYYRQKAKAKSTNVITFVPAYQLTASVFDGWFRRAG